MNEVQSDSAPQKSWFGKNWKWFVPVGCLLPMLVCCGGPVAILFGIATAIKSSEPYTVSLSKAQANAEVQAALGDNIQSGFVASGSINLNNADGDADITYDIKGSKGAAVVHVVGVKKSGKWEYTVMEVTILPDNKTVNLLDEHADHDHGQDQNHGHDHGQDAKQEK